MRLPATIVLAPPTPTASSIGTHIQSPHSYQSAPPNLSVGVSSHSAPSVSLVHVLFHAARFSDSHVREDSIDVNENGRGEERDGDGGGRETGSPLSSTSSLYFALRAEYDRHQILKNPLHSDFI